MESVLSRIGFRLACLFLQHILRVVRNVFLTGHALLRLCFRLCLIPSLGPRNVFSVNSVKVNGRAKYAIIISVYISILSIIIFPLSFLWISFLLSLFSLFIFLFVISIYFTFCVWASTPACISGVVPAVYLR